MRKVVRQKSCKITKGYHKVFSISIFKILHSSSSNLDLLLVRKGCSREKVADPKGSFCVNESVSIPGESSIQRCLCDKSGCNKKDLTRFTGIFFIFLTAVYIM